ncbi:hypothetical protein SAY87_003779 [Trapa incisa]|uniref:SPARK domain-containing protein n=1 Tax=Trapa incisa TaxID=236973 RepID=A0AAN7KPX9_9MYRT|nr:hypothetical protein SAY87_003779 [Trapa incisa]
MGGSICHQFLLLILLLSGLQESLSPETHFASSQEVSISEMATPPSTGIFYPIQISPSMIPPYLPQNESSSPMYPNFPQSYEPVLTGKCPINFSAISTILTKTASDCSSWLAPLAANVICCPQFNSLLYIFQGFYSSSSDKLVVQTAVASDCFSDIVSILVSRGAINGIPSLCSIKSSNLTGGSCPVNDVATFEMTVNTRKLLDLCASIDPLKECCRPLCQHAIAEAALRISGGQISIDDNRYVVSQSSRINVLNDCKGVVYSYISRKLSSDTADTSFRILSSCKVNKVCPLKFEQPVKVINACRNVAAPSSSCCNSLNMYISGIQKKMLITNKQAILCATLFGSMLRKGGVMENVYELCDVDLKNFSIQVSGCLLRSLPSDLVFDNSSGLSFICDLTDNIAAPWPTSSMQSMSLCPPEMSLPALPSSETAKNPGSLRVGLERFVPFLVFVLGALMLY